MDDPTQQGINGTVLTGGIAGTAGGIAWILYMVAPKLAKWMDDRADKKHNQKLELRKMEQDEKNTDINRITGILEKAVNVIAQSVVVQNQLVQAQKDGQDQLTRKMDELISEKQQLVQGITDLTSAMNRRTENVKQLPS